WIDAVLGIIVAGFIFYSGYEIISENINHLLGTKPEKILIEKTSNICKQIAGKDIQAHHFHLHDYVNHQELSFHIRLDSKMNLKKAHALTVQIEEKIYKELNIFATIHLEPLES
ncbi:MAG: cation transporter dimerization domain-containing protein, partial [Candidatus Cloacimonadota bacterium]|nr:cation transporter dimerization domain-containing protein [Candidatus Cloacimonadota bacterium]